MTAVLYQTLALAAFYLQLTPFGGVLFIVGLIDWCIIVTDKNEAKGG